MKASFDSFEAWTAGIAAAVRESLKFDAWQESAGVWIIEYTGGY